MNSTAHQTHWVDVIQNITKIALVDATPIKCKESNTLHPNIHPNKILKHLEEAGYPSQNPIPSHAEALLTLFNTKNSPSFSEEITIIKQEPILNLITSTISHALELNAFIHTFMSHLKISHDDALKNRMHHLEENLIALALAKQHTKLLPNFEIFKKETLDNQKNNIKKIKELSFMNNQPTPAEFMELITATTSKLRFISEEDTGYKPFRNVYHEELLSKQRMLELILQKTCDELGLDPEPHENLTRPITPDPAIYDCLQSTEIQETLLNRICKHLNIDMSSLTTKEGHAFINTEANLST